MPGVEVDNARIDPGAVCKAEVLHRNTDDPVGAGQDRCQCRKKCGGFYLGMIFEIRERRCFVASIRKTAKVRPTTLDLCWSPLRVNVHEKSGVRKKRTRSPGYHFHYN